MGNNFRDKEDILKAIDLALTGLLQMLDPKDVSEVAQALCEALVELNPNLILDKKENKNVKV